MRPTMLYLLVLSLAATCCWASPDWPVFRHDAQLTGRSDLAGDITAPRIVAEHFVGAWDGWAIVHPEANRRDTVVTEPCTGDMSEVRRQFGLAAPTYDLRGDGNLVALADRTGSQVAKILPDVPGLQMIKFDDAFGYKGDERGHMYAYDGEERREVWRTEPEDNMFMPLVLILDADGDGDLEAVVATHYRVMVFDAQMGHKDAEIRFHGFRNYGFFGAKDIDGDGLAEYVIITDFSSHLDVVDYEGGELKLLWRRDIDPDIVSRSKVVRVGPNPVVDVDGDGRQELVFNLYGDTADGQWHVVAYDALTGGLKWDLPGRFLQGMARLDPAGPPLLMTVDTEGMPLPVWGTLRILQIANGAVTERWRTRRARWEVWDVPSLPPTRRTGATLGKQTCLVDEDTGVFYVSRPGHAAQRVICGMQWKQDSVAELWRVMGPGLEVAASRETDEDGLPELLMKLRSPHAEATLRTAGAGLALVAMNSAGTLPTSPVAADLDGDGLPELIVNDAAGSIVALKRQPDAEGLQWAELWRAPGRAMADSQTQWYGVQVADVDQDGEPEVLVGGSNDRGQAELRALSADGDLEWSRAFEHIEGSDPFWNRGCLTYWSVLDANGTPAVYASVRRNLMHSDESYMLRGADGSTIWHRDKVQCPHAVRGVGGKMIAAQDINDDGFEEVVITYPDVVMVLSGKDGAPLVTHPTTGDDLPGWTAYAVPVIADSDADGTLEIYWTASTYTTAAFDTAGKVIWHSEYRDGMYVQGCWALPALADINEDGRLELVGGGYKEGLRVYDGATGRLLGTLKLPAPSGPAASADINGDGLEEALIPCGDNTLWAVNMPGDKPQVAWKLALPSVPSAPIVADLDGDGKAEIAVVCRDGYLRIVDGP